MEVIFGRHWREADCCFVLGTGRCGTKALAEFLSFSSLVESHHEPQPTLIAERQRAFLQLPDNAGEFALILQYARQNAIALAQKSGKVYVETSPRMTFFAPVIVDMLPKARFIYLHRHPGDVVRSGMRRGWYVNHPLDRYRIYPHETHAAHKNWEFWGAFEKCCWYWQACNRFALEIRKHVPERIFTVPSRDLFDVHSGIHEQICDFIGVDVLSIDEAKRSLRRPVNEQRDNEFPLFADWDAGMTRTLYQVAGTTMRELGYEAPADLWNGQSTSMPDNHVEPLIR